MWLSLSSDPTWTWAAPWTLLEQNRMDPFLEQLITPVWNLLLELTPTWLPRMSMRTGTFWENCSKSRSCCNSSFHPVCFHRKHAKLCKSLKNNRAMMRLGLIAKRQNKVNVCVHGGKERRADRQLETQIRGWRCRGSISDQEQRSDAPLT